MNALTIINTVGLITLVFFSVYIVFRSYSMVTKAEYNAQQDEVIAQLQKVQAESEATKAKVAELEAVIAGAGDSVPDEVVAKFAELKAQVSKNDEVIQDPPIEPTP